MLNEKSDALYKNCDNNFYDAPKFYIFVHLWKLCEIDINEFRIALKITPTLHGKLDAVSVEGTLKR